MTIQYLLLDSRKRSSGTHENPKYKLKRPLTLNKLEKSSQTRIRMRLIQATIPYSFYTIIPGKNKIKANGTITIIEPGNYNIFQLLKALPFEAKYSTITNRCTLYVDTITFDEETPYVQLGFEKGVYNKDSIGIVITSSSTVNISPLSSVYVRAIGLTQTNTEESGRDSGFSDVLAKVPINCNPAEVIFYLPPVPPEISVLSSEVNELELELTTRDSDNRINLNGLDWTCTIEVNIDHNLLANYGPHPN